MRLDGLNGQEHEVVDEANLLLDERFGVADAGEQAVVSRGGEGPLADIFFRNEEPATGGLIGVLRPIGEQGLKALVNEWSDVDDEGRADVGVERGVEDLVGAVRRARDVELRQTAGEAGLVAESGCRVVVGVAALPVRKDDDAWPKTSEDSGDLQTVGLGVFDIAVRKVERLAMRNVENACGCLGFGASFVRGTPGAGLALGEVEDAGAPPAGVHGKQRAAAGLLDVVTVCGDSENVNHGKLSVAGYRFASYVATSCDCYCI